MKLNDFQFLFNKKLSNMEKMSLLQLRKQKNSVEIASSRKEQSSSSISKFKEPSRNSSKTYEPQGSSLIENPQY